MVDQTVYLVSLLLLVKIVGVSSQHYAECRNYTVLNTRDRSQNEGLNRGVCDLYEITSKGWYHFSGDAGYAMPTSCVPTYRCGTYAPGWMQGSHPSVAEGAVTRTVCYHWNGNCCIWSNNIRVRNCGGFYVYELDRTPNCNLRYCGNGAVYNRCNISNPCSNGGTCTNDLSGGYSCNCSARYTGRNCTTENLCHDSNNPCRNGGTCVVGISGGSSCICPVGYTGKNCETGKGKSVICKENYMQIDLDKSVFGDIDARDFHLNLKSCRASVNGNTITLSTFLDGCGTTHQQTEKSITYWNEVKTDDSSHSSNGTSITRARNIHLPFYCKYGRKKSVSTSFSHKGSFFASEGSYGNFTFTMELYRTAAYQAAYRPQDYPVSVGINEPLYVQYSVSSTTADLIVFAESCRATTTDNPNSSPQYVFIREGCGVDDTMSYIYKQDIVQQFIIKSFRFIIDNPVVYLHCQLMVCHKKSNNSRCTLGCQNSLRRRRDASDIEGSKAYNMSTDKLIRKEDGEKKASAGESKANPILVGGLVTVGALFIVVAIVLSVIVHRNSKRNKIVAAHVQDPQELGCDNAAGQDVM